MQVHVVKKTHFMLFQLLTIVASFSHRGTIGPSGFEIITRSPYVPAAYYNYRQYNDGRLENPVRANNFRNLKKDLELFNEDVFIKSDDIPKYKEVHLKDGISSMIMDIKMPPLYYYREGNNNLYNFDFNKILQQWSSTASGEFLPHKVLNMKIQQENNPKQNVNSYKEIMNLATFFSSGGDIVDYGYSAGNSMVEDEMNSLSRLDKGDVMNINFMGTEISPAAGTYKNPVDAASIENIEFSSEKLTESYKPDAFEEDFLDRSHYPPDVVASLIGG